jgi:hypothetical protein
VAVDRLMLLALAVIATAAVVHGLWQMVRGWRALRRGGSSVPVADGVSRVLGGAFGWMVIAVLTEAGLLAALIMGLTFLGLSVFVRLRLGSAGRRR